MKKKNVGEKKKEEEQTNNQNKSNNTTKLAKPPSLSDNQKTQGLTISQWKSLEGRLAQHSHTVPMRQRLWLFQG